MKKELKESHSSCPHMGGNTNKISCIQYPPMNTGFLLSLCCGKCLSEIQTDLNGIKSNPSMKLLREEHKRKFNINAINLTCIEFTNSHTNETIYLRDTNHHSFKEILSDDWDPNDIEVASLMLIGIDNNINVNDIIRTILSIINPVISHTHC